MSYTPVCGYADSVRYLFRIKSSIMKMRVNSSSSLNENSFQNLLCNICRSYLLITKFICMITAVNYDNTLHLLHSIYSSIIRYWIITDGIICPSNFDWFYFSFICVTHRQMGLWLISHFRMYSLLWVSWEYNVCLLLYLRQWTFCIFRISVETVIFLSMAGRCYYQYIFT